MLGPIFFLSETEKDDQASMWKLGEGLEPLFWHSLIHNFQALVSRRELTLATPTNTGGCAEYKCRPLHREGLLAAAPRHPVLSRDS